VADRTPELSRRRVHQLVGMDTANCAS